MYIYYVDNSRLYDRVSKPQVYIYNTYMRHTHTYIYIRSIANVITIYIYIIV